MASDHELWFDKYYQGNTKKYLDSRIQSKLSENPNKTIETAKRQIYDSLPTHIKWNEETERSGTAYSGVVLDYFTPAPVTVEPITPISTVHPQDDHIVTISAATNQIISDITAGVLQVPDWFHNNINWFKNGQLNENDFLTSFHNLVNQNIIHEAIAEPEPTPEINKKYWVKKPSGTIEEIWITDSAKLKAESIGWVFNTSNIWEELIVVPEPEPEWSGWVTKPSGIIEYMTMTISTKQTLEGQGWIFTLDKPVTPQPENENISIIFYTGTGGDLKTHFNINSIIVTPEEKEELVKWLYQSYGTSIILAVNRLTNDVRTHTAQQVKAYVIQKIQDDTPEPVLPTPITPPTITGKSGIMGAGVAGAIALLILGGFIIDSRRKK